MKNITALTILLIYGATCAYMGSTFAAPKAKEKIVIVTEKVPVYLPIKNTVKYIENPEFKKLVAAIPEKALAH